jgi:hypothetical protein
MLNVDTAAMTMNADDAENTAATDEDTTMDFNSEPKTQTDVWANVTMRDLVERLPALVPENDDLRFDVE